MRPEVAQHLRAPGAHDDQATMREAEHAERGKQRRHADAGRLQHGHDAAGADHVGGIEHVDGGDHARAPVDGGAQDCTAANDGTM